MLRHCVHDLPFWETAIAHNGGIDNETMTIDSRHARLNNTTGPTLNQPKYCWGCAGPGVIPSGRGNMHTATPDGDSFPELKLEVAVICMISSISQRGVLKARRPPLAYLPGVGYDVLAHSTDPPSVVSISLSPVRAGSMLPNSVWHGLPAEAPGNSRSSCR